MDLFTPGAGIARKPGPGLIRADQLRLFAPQSNYVALAPMLDREAGRCEINTPRRLCHWLAHLHVESAGFTRLDENLSYSAERLCAVWPRRFLTLASAEPYAHNPKALGNKVYGGRMGNVGPDDGWRYRGGSWIQLTGRDNYAAASKWTGLDLLAGPDLARTPAVACTIAADFWRVHDLNRIVDEDPGEMPLADLSASLRANEEDDLEQATPIVNGGENGLDDRRRQLMRASTIWRA